ncbi:MAG TPA: ATP-grasp domain-containing protein [Pyrinomonadaceae bacterium]|jgi:biotin carboxylase
MNELKQKHLLYLDTRDLPAERDEEINAARDLGYGLIIATDRPARFKYHRVDHVIETPLGDYEHAQADIVGYLESHRIEPAGIVSWKDREVELASALTTYFKLPGNSLESARRVRDKAQTRRALDAIAGVNPKYAVIANRSDFETAIKTMSCPCLLKPAGNSGSRGIFRIADPASGDVYEEFCRYTAQSKGDMFSYYTDHALLEEELSGSEHSVAGLIANGQVYVTAIADKKFERDIFMQFENIVPSLLDADTQRAMVTAVTEAVTVLGLSNGGFHADVIIGKNNRPHILEVGGRPGGELINSNLIPLAYDGYSPYQQLIRILTNDAPDLVSDRYQRPTMRAGSRIVRAPRTGKIKQVRGLETVARHPAVRVLMPMKGPEDNIYKPRDSFKEYEVAYIVAQCPLDEDIETLLSSLDQLVSVEMYDEHSLVSSASQA